MLDIGLEAGAEVPLELLRQASYGIDPDLAKKARVGMQQTKDPLAIELIADTLRGPMAKAERKGLIDALDGFSATSTHARTLATAHRALDGQKSAIDGKKWQSVLVGAAYTGAVAVDRAKVALERDQALAAKPDDPDAHLDVAESNLLQALELVAGAGPGAVRMTRLQRTMLFDDARRHIQEAIAAGAGGWRPSALQAIQLQQIRQSHRQIVELVFELRLAGPQAQIEANLDELPSAEWARSEKSGGHTFMGKVIPGVTKTIVNMQNSLLYGKSDDDAS